MTEWLTDSGSCYLARSGRTFACDLSLIPKGTRMESPQSGGIAEAIVRTLKCDYVRVSAFLDAGSVLRQIPVWLARYNNLHSHRALDCRSPRELIALSIQTTLFGL